MAGVAAHGLRSAQGARRFKGSGCWRAGAPRDQRWRASAWACWRAGAAGQLPAGRPHLQRRHRPPGQGPAARALHLGVDVSIPQIVDGAAGATQQLQWAWQAAWEGGCSKACAPLARARLHWQARCVRASLSLLTRYARQIASRQPPSRRALPWCVPAAGAPSLAAGSPSSAARAPLPSGWGPHHGADGEQSGDPWIGQRPRGSGQRDGPQAGPQQQPGADGLVQPHELRVGQGAGWELAGDPGPLLGAGAGAGAGRGWFVGAGAWGAAAAAVLVTVAGLCLAAGGGVQRSRAAWQQRGRATRTGRGRGWRSRRVVRPDRPPCAARHLMQLRQR
jgi:hypothetical protein